MERLTLQSVQWFNISFNAAENPPGVSLHLHLKDSGSKTENTQSRKQVISEAEVRSGSDLMRTACLNNPCQMAHTILWKAISGKNSLQGGGALVAQLVQLVPHDQHLSSRCSCPGGFESNPLPPPACQPLFISTPSCQWTRENANKWLKTTQTRSACIRNTDTPRSSTKSLHQYQIP